MTFDLIIPCYNPSAGWERKLVLTIASLHEKSENIFQQLVRVIIVNDGSTAGVTPSALFFIRNSGLPFRIVHRRVNRGKGYSIREGVRLSTAESCIYTDLDLPFGIESVLHILNALEKGADIALGTRSKKAYYLRAPLSRKWMSMALMFMNRYVLGIPFEDSQAGIKGFNQYGKALFLQTCINRFLFDLEFIKMAMAYDDMKIVPVNIQNDGELILSRFNLKIILQEAGNFLLILLKSKYGFRTKKDPAWN